MKRLLLFSILCFSSIAQGYADPKYIVIRQRFLYGWTLKHVDKPKKLHKWYYDKQTDTYYRMKTSLGIGVKLK
jgi:hypothetical protein